MKFVKGIVIGSMITAGAYMLYADNMGLNRKKMMKQGRKLMKKMGM